MLLRILSWNCQSIRGKISELANYLENNFFHVILIQETWLNESIHINLRNFICIRKDRPLKANSKMSHGGVLIFIRQNIDFKVIKFPSSDLIESLFIKISVDSRNIIIGSIYNPSSLSVKESKENLFKICSASGNFIMAGDFNAKHSSWNNVRENRKGRDLMKICEDKMLDIHFPNSPTLYPDGKGDPSIVDLVISRGILGISKPISYDGLSSDHRPVEFSVPFFIRLPQELKVKNFKKTNWKAYQESVARDFTKINGASSLDTGQAIDEQIDKFVEIIRNAEKIAIPLKKPFVFRYPQSQDIKNLIVKRNALRKATVRNPAFKKLVNQLNREIKYKTTLLNSQSFNDKLSKLKLSDNSLHQFVRIIKRKKKQIPPLCSPNDDLVYTDKEKADLIASAFEKAHKISNAPTCHTQAVQTSSIVISQSTVDIPNHERISVNEVSSLIKSLKVKKASGCDNISNLSLKALPSEGFVFLTSIFNSCLKLSHFPTVWKKGKIVALPKPDKNLSDPSSYRPITLLPMIGKLFERLVLERLQYFESQNKIFIPQQFGFRSKHSTTQQIVRLMETISLRFNQDKSTAACLLDCEKAFDSCWHDGLLHKLLKLQYPMYLIKIIGSFLANRSSYVSINDSKSNAFDIPAGVPQGSPLSPHLFNVFINDIPVPKFCKLAVFADDTALLSSVKNYELPKLVSRMESALQEIEDHFTSWKMKLNKNKTQAILFTKSTKMLRAKDNNKINFNGTTLDWLPTAKYLGIHLDSKLTLKHHVAMSIKKAQKALSVLYCFMRKYSRVKTRYKILMYKSYIRPTFTYASPALSNCAKTHLRKFQIFQNKCLRMALSAPYRTHISDLHSQARMPTVREYIDKLTETFYNSCETVGNDLIKKLGSYSKTPTPLRFKHKMPKAVC